MQVNRAVQVKNEKSEHNERAGVVIRAEGPKKIFVELDANQDGKLQEVVVFAKSELVML